MPIVDAILDAKKRIAAGFLALFVLIIAIMALFRGAILLSIVLHVVGFALVVYIAYKSAPPRT